MLTLEKSLLGLLLALSLSLPSMSLVAQSPAGSSATNDDPSAEKVVKLSAFEVVGGSAGYGAQYSSSSSRLNLRYIDVPQSIGVVTGEFLNDAFVFDSREFTKYVPNVQQRANTHQPEIMYVRGLQISNTYVDGYIAPLAVNRDRGLYDRVEYVKGPASAAMGRGEAGGLVNFVSKSPLSTDRNIGDITIGSDSFYRAEFDHNARITSNGKMAYRIPLFYEQGDGPRGGERAARPPQVQRARVPVADRLLAGRLLVDGVERERDFDELLGRLDRVGHRQVPGR